MSKQKREKAHPPPNRGVLRTQNPQNDYNYGLFLDYLRGTISPLTFQKIADYETGEVVTFAEPNEVEIETIFGTMTPLEYSTATGYNQSATLPCGGKVHWHTTKPEQRVLINLGGEALAQLGIHPLTLLEKLDPMGFKATRMDWAKDDTEGLLDLGVIQDKIRKGEMVSRFAKWNRIEGGVIGDDVVTGETIYIGNRKSESFIRVYDKAAEQAAKEGVEVVGHHLRVELEIKKRKAQELLSKILETHRAGGDVAELVLGVVYGLVDFKEPNSTDTNKRRWSTCDWWLKFLGVGEKVRITVPKPEITLDRAKDWLNHISPTAAIVKEIDPVFIDQTFVSGKARWSNHHKAKLQRWQAEHNQQEQPFVELQTDLIELQGAKKQCD